MDENQEMEPQDGPEDFLEQLLSGFLGSEGAKEAAQAMRAHGFDMSALGNFASPHAMAQAMGQFRHLMKSSNEPVNWSMVSDISRQMAYQSGDPRLSAAQAARARQALSVADLWLDPVTDFAVQGGKRGAWTRSQWVEETLPAWKKIFNPVAQNVARAMTEVLEDQAPMEHGLPDGMEQLLGGLQQMVPKMSAMSFGTQVGQALAGMAKECFGTSDTGFPLTEPGIAALVPTNIGAFADGLDEGYDVVEQYVAVREMAYVRLFASVPWLRHDLELAVTRYAREIALDTDALTEAARSFDPSNPESVTQMMSGGIFSAEPSESQEQALMRLETLLSLIEGWVETVTTDAVVPYLPGSDRLREMLRRRRVTGSAAEAALGDLVGLKLRPRMARAAARIFRDVEIQKGPAARDALWRHPDAVPTLHDLENPEDYGAPAEPEPDDIDFDREIQKLLDGTLGWDKSMPKDLRGPDASDSEEDDA